MLNWGLGGFPSVYGSKQEERQRRAIRVPRSVHDGCKDLVSHFLYLFQNLSITRLILVKNDPHDTRPIRAR